MFFKKRNNETLDVIANLEKQVTTIASINNECATIQFTTDGVVTDVSEQFAKIVGYTKEELIGKRHRELCSDQIVSSPKYSQFWSDLANGKTQAGSFPRIRKDGQTIWLEASYIPIRHNGRVVGILKIAQDVSDQVRKSRDNTALLEAINRSNAVIEFSTNGTVLNANDNFVRALGYSNKNDIIGKPHSIFCFEEFYAENPTFWQDLARGQVKDGLFRRMGRAGNTVWIEATYNPIFDENNRVIKITKLASDVTERVERQQRIQHAAEIAHSTSVETAQVSTRGASILDSNIANSEKSVKQIEATASIVSELNTQSQEITNIVSTIRGIADQTNLLALNAAIEAARAGEQGRGFAVVADEVRTLASRTSTSTEDITQMVEKNRALVEKVMLNMSQISDDANTNSNLIREAATIIEEILKGADYVSEVVGELVGDARS
ncbi:methyl-accepting chemotaxis protein [Vibrio viridaestus]|uniref:Methyl-accepting chemotaxis protein n=1 Tax=Vibrio viridaestus TaxID=2487322 RepID=A0A3N9TF97_9VIBR|nr:PAS domain-containing methyl-accepting chemotaxis protein [Vibrio viridaestus]RQW62799.1 methyl-accepting chemotaxis protein [Vibrio viridaestus]